MVKVFFIDQLLCAQQCEKKRKLNVNLGLSATLNFKTIYPPGNGKKQSVRASHFLPAETISIHLSKSLCTSFPFPALQPHVHLSKQSKVYQVCFHSMAALASERVETSVGNQPGRVFIDKNRIFDVKLEVLVDFDSSKSLAHLHEKICCK